MYGAFGSGWLMLFCFVIRDKGEGRFCDRFFHVWGIREFVADALLFFDT